MHDSMIIHAKRYPLEKFWYILKTRTDNNNVVRVFLKFV